MTIASVPDSFRFPIVDWFADMCAKDLITLNDLKLWPRVGLDSQNLFSVGGHREGRLRREEAPTTNQLADSDLNKFKIIHAIANFIKVDAIMVIAPMPSYIYDAEEEAT